MGCFQEMCRNWSGSGCVCAVFGVEPAEVCEHGYDAASCLACEGRSAPTSRARRVGKSAPSGRAGRDCGR